MKYFLEGHLYKIKKYMYSSNASVVKSMGSINDVSFSYHLQSFNTRGKRPNEEV